MPYHVPRLRNAAALFLTGILPVFLGGLYASGPALAASVVFGVLLIYLGLMEVRWLSDSFNNEKIRLETERIRAVANCPPERLNALGMTLPELNLTVAGEQPAAMWENSGVPLWIFQEFLEGCRREYIYPIREWRSLTDADKAAGITSGEKYRMCELIMLRLYELGYVKSVEDRGNPRGPRSWLFEKNAYERLQRVWGFLAVTYGGALRELAPGD